MMQQSIVYLIVAYAAWVVAKRYAPLWLRRGCSSWLHAKFTALGWNRIAERFVPNATAAASCGDGCGSCNNCAANDAGAPIATTAAIKEFSVTPDALRQTIRR
jgi:hypothetical protein